MRVTVIVNPHSGNQKKHAENLEQLRNMFLRYPEIDFSLYETNGPGHATRLAEDSAIRGDKVSFAVGGDGTVNEVGCGLIGSNTSLGILPVGSGNGLARHLKIPLQLDLALDAQLNGESIGLDYGTVNGVPFFLAAGIGFEGVVAARFATKKNGGLWLTFSLPWKNTGAGNPSNMWLAMKKRCLPAQHSPLTLPTARNMETMPSFRPAPP